MNQIFTELFVCLFVFLQLSHTFSCLVDMALNIKIWIY